METLTVLVTGVFNSGKTEFIWRLSEVEWHEKTFTSDRTITGKMTLALDFGRLKVDENIALHFWGTPGSAPFYMRNAREIFQKDFVTVVMIDSAELQTHAEAGYMISNDIAPSGLPYIVVASKQDLPDALSPDEIRNRLQIPDDIPVLPCIATQRESVKSVLLALLKRMQQDDVIQKAIAKIEAL